jgi:OFA family oxalate/formate antiporter-like MFS transporter
MKTLYKIYKSVIPCVLLTLCIGFCYAFSLFTPHIALAIGCSVKAVQFTFCLNIFFLGMGAALFGPLVERHIKIASIVSASLLIIGLLIGGLACTLKSILLMYIGCGVMCGIAEGCGYITPNKNMLLWFPASKHKGILSAISIFMFGLGSALCSWLFGILFPIVGIAYTFYILAFIYMIPSFISALIIDKPRYAQLKIEKTEKSKFSYVSKLKDPFFRNTWMFMFMNISMGLILIGSCASILSQAGLSTSTIITVMMLCGIFNGVGRLVFPAIADMLKNRLNILLLTVIFEIIMVCLGMLNVYVIPFAIIMLHAGYGSAFANLPGVLNSYYGKNELSQTHGFCLTSWGVASLMAYLCMSFVMVFIPGLYSILTVVLIGYIINFFIIRRILSIDRSLHDRNK